MFGGADSLSADRVPSDILVESNYFTKRLEWKTAGFAVKNLFELKSARRVTIRGNLFEHNWTDAQTGFGILFKAINQDGTAPWSVLEDVLFESNVVRDTENGFNILGTDYHYPRDAPRGSRFETMFCRLRALVFKSAERSVRS